MRTIISIILWTFAISPIYAQSSKYSAEHIKAESSRVNAFFDKAFDNYVARHPMLAANLGLKVDYDKWDDISDDAQITELAIQVADLAKLKREFDYEALDSQAKISFELFQKGVEDTAEGLRFNLDSYPVNQMYGLHSELPTFLINIHKVANVKDANDYIARLNGVSRLFDQLILKLKARAEHGVITPKFVFPLVLDASRKIIQGQPFDATGPNSPLLVDFSKKIDSLKDVDKVTKDDLLDKAKKAMLTSLKPAYEKLIAYLIELEKLATDDAGVWKFADGTDFYNYSLRQTTTTNHSANEIHEIGLKEVARIHREMESIKDKVGFKGDLQAFLKSMREDSKFYEQNTDEGKAKYLARAVTLIDVMKSRSNELFITKPKAELVVKAVEKFREQSAGSAFYDQPAQDGSRPGMYYVNLRDMKDAPTYELEALSYHEGIPGHHMQIALAQELGTIPKFRKFGGYTAYVEGWGLYSELLPKEIGLYQDPYSDFGRLSMELWRAARLVVDTGIHSKRWTREQAIKYLTDNTPNTLADCTDSINRYIVMPSQATAYKIGMMKILELREMAKKQLGAKFDIRRFHEVVLTNGALPLSVLEKLVKRWVKDTQGS